MAGARAKIAELEAREAEHERSELVQRALYRIAETASAAQDMASFYASIHEIVGELMYAANFYIALHDAKQQTINFPYYVDEVDAEIPDPALWEPFGVGNASGLTAYVLRSGRVTHITRDEWATLIASGEISSVGVEGEEWLGVPLRSEGETVGVLVVQTYEHGQSFAERDVDVLTFVGQHVAQALTRARAIDETRQRNEELALVNEIGSALASKLDFDAIIDLVGERIRGIFRSDSLGISLFDPDTQLLTFPYTIDHGDRVHNDSWKLGPGLTSEVITTRRPLRVNTAEELAAHAPVLVLRFEGDTEFSESWLGVPILAGGRVLGTVNLERPEPHAFTAADERLLSTLASSMGVALENARLFEETKRLLAETDGRAAELAIINSVQQGLAENLDMQAMYDLVGDKIQEIFDAQVVDIGILDREAGVVRYPYTIERGQRFPDEPTEIGKSPLMVELLRERQPILLNDMPAWEREHGMVLIVQGERSLSVLLAPLMTGGEVRGRISLQNLDRTDAFTDADVRLLSTLASSLSVALENARLFDETKRLLAETDERAAELAVVNSVQQGLAANLDMQAMYDLVGDKIQEIFDAQVVDIAVIDRVADEMRFVYGVERGERLEPMTMPLIGPRRHVADSRQPLLINEDAAARVAEYGQEGALQGEMAQSALWAPLIVGDQARGIISLQNLDREKAFSEADVRLLTTLASSLSVALENARLFDETKRLLGETDRRAAELAIVNSVQQGLAAELDVQAMYELVGERASDVFDTQVVDIAIYDRETGNMRFPFSLERGSG